MVSGGFLTPTVPMWAEPVQRWRELRLVVDEAHRHGLPVAAHCHGIAAIEDAIDAGVDAIEHCTFMTSNQRCEPPDELIDRLAASRHRRLVDGRPAVARPAPTDRSRRTSRPCATSRRRLHERGATIVAGTDAGIDLAKPHDVLPHAMAEFVDSGMAPIDALRALTSVAARALALDRRKGRLAKGFDADVLVVAGDPLADPAALASTVAVWHAGQRVGLTRRSTNWARSVADSETERAQMTNRAQFARGSPVGWADQHDPVARRGPRHRRRGCCGRRVRRRCRPTRPPAASATPRPTASARSACPTCPRTATTSPAARCSADAVPIVTRPRRGTVVVDAANGFCHPAFEAGLEPLVDADPDLRCRRAGDHATRTRPACSGGSSSGSPSTGWWR